MKDNFYEDVQFIGHYERRHLMARKNTNKRVDKSVFKRTAAGTKKINISPKVMRGGTRL